MKDVREVLKQKEEEMRQLRAQITCLRIVIPLLIEPGESAPPAPPADEQILEEVGTKKRWP